MGGPNHRRRRVAIVEGPAEFLDQPGEGRVRYEGPRPQTVVQFVLAHHARGFADEEREQIECLRREVNVTTFAKQLPPL